MKRREFISLTATSALLSSVETLAQEKPLLSNVDSKFQLKIMATNWGWSGSLDAFCAAAKKEGYDGIEMWWPNEAKDQKELFAALEKHDLEIGYLCGSGHKDPAINLESFKKAINAASTQSAKKPLYINCHSGKDFFTYEQSKLFIDHTTETSAKTGIKICHETHRGRIMFAAHIARNFIEKNPALHLTLDISHWCNVHESLLEDQAETVSMALERVEHLHARIGHQEGPQVNDPRAPEWESTVKAHFAWWDKVLERKMKAGETMTILTEFGPPNYLPTLPYTQQPVADQWAINVYMMQLLRKRYLR
ncbi:TIM barrel protein [Emticicia sp. W12TSBA100-4]|uniref:sugar phosphate isomerase/epimerase family protein n=1 Tax=Emticicia sp. W12TSBA100-4 TaxID=3160965 RepID=UPI00330654EB